MAYKVVAGEALACLKYAGKLAGQHQFPSKKSAASPERQICQS